LPRQKSIYTQLKKNDNQSEFESTTNK